jgi:hypothetical protein
MSRVRASLFTWLLTIFIVAASRSVSAQGLSGRVALEGIASMSARASAVDDPMVILDLVGTVRLADGWDVVVRPWSMRRPGGDWMFEMYQLQLRYVSSTKLPFRVDAGIIPSPIGLFTLELQPHRNPLISAPSYYFAPLPAVNGRFDNVRLISGGYPLGAVFSLSGMRWDARAGITDRSPVQPANVLSASRPDSHPQVVLGGGVTPVTGMRLGVGFTRGRYQPRTPLGSASALPPRTATVFNIEGEYAVGHTRISGEWVRDQFAPATGSGLPATGPAPQPNVARGFNLQAAQTLSPRIFAAVRATRVSAPVATAPAEVRRSSAAYEATLGYRLTTEFTIRGGYQRERGYQETGWRNAAVMSLVWAERWW